MGGSEGIRHCRCCAAKDTVREPRMTLKRNGPTPADWLMGCDTPIVRLGILGFCSTVRGGSRRVGHERAAIRAPGERIFDGRRWGYGGLRADLLVWIRRPALRQRRRGRSLAPPRRPSVGTGVPRRRGCFGAAHAGSRGNSREHKRCHHDRGTPRQQLALCRPVRSYLHCPTCRGPTVCDDDEPPGTRRPGRIGSLVERTADDTETQRDRPPQVD